jgi:hypothetical protein
MISPDAPAEAERTRREILEARDVRERERERERGNVIGD